MFRHGKPRAFIHNLRLASMLSFVAGTVNISGVLSISTLTTNVTGHFAFFAEDFVLGRYGMAVTYLVYILCFLLGAFLCSFLMEVVIKANGKNPHTIPMLVETGILALLAIADSYHAISDQWMANGLLMSMGLQNALVTKISQATVRTTHLTGLFTDLGIEISQLFFYRASADSKKLQRSIYLRLAIIAGFFLGGVLGGFIYREMHLKVLVFSSAWLLLALLYDNIRLGFHYYRRKLQRRL